MNRNACILIAVLLTALALVPTPSVAQDSSWTIEVAPEFVFSGDSVNVTVTESGVAGSPYFSLNVRAPNGTVMQELVSRTDDLGWAKLVVQFPLETASGFYVFEVAEGGASRANTTVEVVKNDINWLHTLILEDRERLDELRKAIVPLKREVAQHDKALDDLSSWVLLFAMIVVAETVTIISLYGRWLAQKAAESKGKDPITKVVKLYTHMPADGDMGFFMEAARVARDEVVKKRGDWSKDVVPKKGYWQRRRERKASMSGVPMERGYQTFLRKRKERKALKAERRAAKYKAPAEPELGEEFENVPDDTLLDEEREVVEMVRMPPEPAPDPIIGEPMPRMTSAREIAEEMRKARTPLAPLDIDAEDKVSQMVRAMDAKVRVGEVIPPQPKVENNIPIQPPRNMNRKAPAKVRPKARNGRKGAGA